MSLIQNFALFDLVILTLGFALYACSLYDRHHGHE